MPACEEKTCGVDYTPARPWQRFCSTRCRTLHRNEEVRNRHVGPTALVVVKAAMEWFRDEGGFPLQRQLYDACATHQKQTTGGTEP